VEVVKTVYYAHPMALYGSPVERKDLSTLRALGFKVINPALKEYATLDMDGFVKLACSCDLVAFRAFEDGKIGSGVAKEIEGARTKGIPVMEMSGDLSRRVLNRNETRQRMCLPPLRHPETAPIRTFSDNPLDGFAFNDLDFGDQ
jgi:hypothetical protein